MDYKERTKAQLLQDIALLGQKNDELKALEHECRMQAEELQSLNRNIDRQKRDLEVLHTITDAVHQSFDLQHIYNTALDLAVTLQDIDLAFIYLISEDRKEAVLKAGRLQRDSELVAEDGSQFGGLDGLLPSLVRASQAVHIEGDACLVEIVEAQKEPFLIAIAVRLGRHETLFLGPDQVKVSILDHQQPAGVEYGGKVG